MKQRRFTGAARPDDRKKVTFGDGQIHAAQRVHIHFTHAIRLLEIANFNHTRAPQSHPDARL